MVVDTIKVKKDERGEKTATIGFAYRKRENNF